MSYDEAVAALEAIFPGIQNDDWSELESRFRALEGTDKKRAAEALVAVWRHNRTAGMSNVVPPHTLAELVEKEIGGSIFQSGTTGLGN